MRVTRSIRPQRQDSNERCKRLVEGIRGVAADVPEGYAGVDDRQPGFVLVVFHPAPDVLPLERLVAFAEAQLFGRESCGEGSYFAEWGEEEESGGVQVEDGWVLQAGGFSYCAVCGPMENVKAVAGAVAPFGVGGDSWQPD